MAGNKIHSAKKRRFINNTIVHVILGILAVIWVFPIVWVILTSFRAEKGSYVSTFSRSHSRWITMRSCSRIQRS